MPGYTDKKGVVAESYQNMNNAPVLDLSGKMNVALVLLAILVLMCGYVCFKK